MLDEIRNDEVGKREFVGVIAALALGLKQIAVAKDFSFVSGVLGMFLALEFHSPAIIRGTQYGVNQI